MKGKAKSRIALVLAAALGLGAVGALSSMAWLTERTTNFDPDPSGVAAIGAEDEAAGENDGSGASTGATGRASTQTSSDG